MPQSNDELSDMETQIITLLRNNLKEDINDKYFIKNELKTEKMRWHYKGKRIISY